jgi:hypothetical protein
MREVLDSNLFCFVFGYCCGLGTYFAVLFWKREDI